MRKKEISFEEKVFYAFDRMMERLVPYLFLFAVLYFGLHFIVFLIR